MILTLADPRDDHALFVQEGLRAKGSDSVLWFTADLAQLQAVSVEISMESPARLSAAGPDLHLGAEPPSVVWLRRPARPIQPRDLHPADRAWAQKEYEEFHGWLIHGLPDNAFWVNSVHSSRRARSKLEQQHVARQVGLHIPRTLYSNDPAEIRAFLRAHGGRAVYKAYTQSSGWKMKDEGLAMLFTALLTEEGLPGDEVLRATPGIYQECLPKAYELRVTVIGRHIFPAKIDSQAMKLGRLDWRRSFEDMHLRFAPTELPPELNGAILRLMERMDLAFGCLDFIVTPEGETIFLEVNEMGQFLFVEECTEQPLLDAFCEMLLQRRRDFTWDPSRVTVRLGDFISQVGERQKQVLKEHLLPPQEIAGFEGESEPAVQ